MEVIKNSRLTKNRTDRHAPVDLMHLVSRYNGSLRNTHYSEGAELKTIEWGSVNQ